MIREIVDLIKGDQIFMRSYEEMEKEIAELKSELTECQKIIDAMSVPIIPSIVPETVLIPVTGKIVPERLDKIISKVSDVTYASDITTAIIDFTAIGKEEIGEIDVFGAYIIKLTSTLKILGIDVLYVGFTPDVVQEIVKSEFYNSIELQAFQSFKTALQHLMQKKGIQFIDMAR